MQWPRSDVLANKVVVFFWGLAGIPDSLLSFTSHIIIDSRELVACCQHLSLLGQSQKSYHGKVSVLLWMCGKSVGVRMREMWRCISHWIWHAVPRAWTRRCDSPRASAVPCKFFTLLFLCSSPDVCRLDPPGDRGLPWMTFHLRCF